MGGVCPLFFDGAVCNFQELPKPDNKTELTKIYNYLDHIRGITAKSFFNYEIKKNNKNLKENNKSLRDNKLLSKFAALFKQI